MREMLNMMRLQAEMAGNNRAMTRVCTVISYDPSNYCAKVIIQPDGIETGWLPVTSPWIGNGWGLFAPPLIGDMVEVQFQEGSIEAGFIVGRFFSDEQRPLAAPPGEFWLVHQSGSKLKFHNDGTVELVAAGTLTSSAPQWNHTGPVSITGNVQITGTQSVSGNITGGANITAAGNVADQGGAKTMSGMRTAYNSHTHTDPQGGNTSTPNQSM